MKKQYQLERLKEKGKIHVYSSKNHSWIRIEEFWNKWRVNTSWGENWEFETAEQAIEKVSSILT